MTKKDLEIIAGILRRLDIGLARACDGKISPSTFHIQFQASFVPNVADELAETNARFDREGSINAAPPGRLEPSN